MSWSASAGAVKYVLEASKDSAFPANGVVFRWERETPSTDILITTVDRGTSARGSSPSTRTATTACRRT